MNDHVRVSIYLKATKLRFIKLSFHHFSYAKSEELKRDNART